MLFLFLWLRWLRRLLPLCLSLFILGCGGGSGGSSTPADPSAPPSTPDAAPQFAAEPGSARHVTLTWNGGLAGTAWRLERRQGDAGDYQLVAEIDSAARLWLDAGLSPDTTYGYRLSRADGTPLASTATRTGTEAALLTDAPLPLGDAMAMPVTPATAQLSFADGSLRLDLPAGSLSQAGSATLQPVSNPLPDGDGLGMSLTLPERPARTLRLTLRYDADEDVDAMLQDRLALRQADGSWWLLPFAGHDEAQRLLRVELPPSVWLASAALRASVGVQATLLRVKAHKLVPAAASVRVLGRQRFVPVSIYRAVVGSVTRCGELPDGEVCVPTPILADQTLPIRNDRTGFEREWTLEGSATPDATLGSLSPETQAGAVYTAPAQVPATNPLTLRFRSVNKANGRALVLKATVRVTEDAWAGRLDAFVGDPMASHHFRLDTRWSLDAAQSTDTRRVYRPGGSATHVYTVTDPVCTHAVSPGLIDLAQADTSGQLVVDESTRPARYTLALSTIWDATLTIACPRGSTSAPIKGGHVWFAEGTLTDGRIAGEDGALGERSWSLGRPQ